MAQTRINCTDPGAIITMEWIEVSINEKLSELTIKAITCGEFTKLEAYTGQMWPNNEQGIDLTHLIYENPDDPLTGTIDIVVMPEHLNMSNIIDDIIILKATTKRCWNDSGIPVEPCPENPGSTITVRYEEGIQGVASFASLYPCLIHKVITADDTCEACNGINDALTLDLMMKAVEVYLRYDRPTEACLAYEKAKVQCQDYEDIFRALPGACDLYGGIGCWIVDKTFIVQPDRPGTYV